MKSNPISEFNSPNPKKQTDILTEFTLLGGIEDTIKEPTTHQISHSDSFHLMGSLGDTKDKSKGYEN